MRLSDSFVGAVFDLDLGPDELTRVPQTVRVTCTELFVGPDDVERARFKAIGGGPTNVPRWQAWPTLVYDVDRVASLLKTEMLRLVLDHNPDVATRNDAIYTTAIRRWFAQGDAR